MGGGGLNAWAKPTHRVTDIYSCKIFGLVYFISDIINTAVSSYMHAASNIFTSMQPELLKIGHDLLFSNWTDRGLVYILCIYIYIYKLLYHVLYMLNYILSLLLIT
jgi:hypothetical protein